MQELKDASADQPQMEDRFLKAEDLRNITLTPEELFQQVKANICDSIMESMVGVATKNGQLFYATNILCAMDDKLREEVMQRFEDLGYETKLSQPVVHEQSKQKYQVLSIGWAKKKDSDETQQSPE